MNDDLPLKPCQHCRKEMPRDGISPRHYERRRFCSHACMHAAKRTQGGPCSVCGKPSWSRGLCNTHYAAWLYREKLEVRQAINRRNAARYAARPYPAWTEDEREAARARGRRYMRIGRRSVTDAYIRALYGLPQDTAPLVMETYRTHILLKRKGRRRAAEVETRAVLTRIARFVPGRAMSGSE